MSGSGTQNSLRKAIGTIKDSINLAKVNSEFKELDVSIVKATNHDARPAKEKHMQAIFAAISATRPRADVSYCIYALKRRLSKTHNWVVALKTLIVIHRAIREVDPTFQELLKNETDSLFNLSNFKDDSNRNVYYSWVQPYASYIKKRLEYLKALEYDVQTLCTITRDQDTNRPLRQLIDRILDCEPKGPAAHNVVIQLAFSMVASESVKVYNNLVDKFIEMERAHPLISFKKGETLAKCFSNVSEMCSQARRLCKFYETCKSIKTGMRNGLIKIEPPPSLFIQVIEQYVEEARWALGYAGDLRPVKRKPYTSKLAIEYKKEAEAQENRLPPPGEPVKVEAHLAEQPSDLMNLDDPVQEASGLHQKNDIAMTIVPISDQPSSSAATLMDAEWELALMTAPSSNEIDTSSSKLAGGLDKLTLDSLYDDAEKRTNQTMSYNPWEHGPMPGSMMQQQTLSDPFYDSTMMAAPSNVQIAAIPQQQDFMLQQQQQQMIMMNPPVPPQSSNPFTNLYEPSPHPHAYNAEMSSSSSSSSRLIDLHEREVAEEHTNARVRCRCNVYAKCWTSWTLNNPGRRFIECPNYLDPTRYCMFFNWVDPELPNEWYRSRMYDMYMKVKKAKSEDGELNFYKNAYRKSGIDQQCLQKEVEIHKATKIFYDKILIMLLGVIFVMFLVYKL